MIDFSGPPHFDRVFQRTWWFTEPKALVRSRYNSFCCTLHFTCNSQAVKVMSAVPQAGQDPHREDVMNDLLSCGKENYASSSTTSLLSFFASVRSVSIDSLSQIMTPNADLQDVFLRSSGTDTITSVWSEWRRRKFETSLKFDRLFGFLCFHR